MTHSENPYESPAAFADEASSAIHPLRSTLSDAMAGALVGTTFGSLGAALQSILAVSLASAPLGPWSLLEQLVFAFVAGACLGVMAGIVIGGALGFALSVLGRISAWRQPLAIRWIVITSGAVCAALAGFAYGVFLSGQMAGSLDRLILSPAGAILGGILGALGGRKWVAIVRGGGG